MHKTKLRVLEEQYYEALDNGIPYPLNRILLDLMPPDKKQVIIASRKWDKKRNLKMRTVRYFRDENRRLSLEIQHDILTAISKRIKSGVSISEALKTHATIKPTIVAGDLEKVGEQSLADIDKFAKKLIDQYGKS